MPIAEESSNNDYELDKLPVKFLNGSVRFLEASFASYGHLKSNVQQIAGKQGPVLLT